MTPRPSTMRRSGAGKPLLLIAGTASDNASWAPLLPLLPGRQLILIDNRGSGQTKVEGPLRPHRHDRGLRRADRPSRHRYRSMSSATRSAASSALGLAALHPDKVARLVTIAIGLR